MPAQKRHKTSYPGVYFIEGKGVPNSVHKIEKIFYITYRKEGRQIHEKAGKQFQDDMTAARAAVVRARRIEGQELSNKRKKAAKKADSDHWTIAKLWDLYCDTHPGNKSLRNEQNKFNRYIRDDLGKKEPSKLLALDVDRLRLGLQKKGKRTTAARVLELLRRSINFGIKRGLVPTISFKIEIPKLNNQTTEDLSPEQLGELLKVLDTEADQTAANLMRLALYTGMRRTEIFKLKWDDIDFQRGFITLQDPKGGSNQMIPLNDSTRAILEKTHRDKGNPFVFPGQKKGSHITDRKKSFKRIFKVAKLPDGFRPLHGLRHVYASMLASSGKVDMYQLQKLLTHKDPRTTQRYIHLRDEALKRASDVADELIGSITSGKDKVIEIEDHKK